MEEQEGAATVCVELISSVLLDRIITLVLQPTADSTASWNDFDGSNLTYIFFTGSGTGAFTCNMVGITEDGILENTEEFSVQLMSNDLTEDVSITQESAIISITDSDSMLYFFKI